MEEAAFIMVRLFFLLALGTPYLGPNAFHTNPLSEIFGEGFHARNSQFFFDK